MCVDGLKPSALIWEKKRGGEGGRGLTRLCREGKARNRELRGEPERKREGKVEIEGKG